MSGTSRGPPVPGPQRSTPPPAAPRPAAPRAPRGEPDDPMRAALVEILRLLNQAERFDDDKEKGLELDEISELAKDHWSSQPGGVKPAVALGLLLRNKMVDHVPGTVMSWTRGRDFGPHYRINGSGKMFLKQAIDDRERIHSGGPKRI